MVAGPRKIIVECLSCGHAAQRTRRADDQRTFSYIQTHARCGVCYARADAGLVNVRPAENARPGFILEEDAEFHPRSRRNDPELSPRPLLFIAPDPAPDPPPEPGLFWSNATWVVGAIFMYTVQVVAYASLMVGAGMAFALLFLVVLPAVPGVLRDGLNGLQSATQGATKAVGFTAAIDHVTSEAARTSTYNFSNPLERAAYCQGREYLIHIRGADVPEHIRQMRRDVIAQCPQLASLR
ncbi:MAG: hypothetical protein SGJ21_12590 [Alphaproteobacteria bacterium]|nr:hypothetical protein [Alphaproteobacteria bacterium]